MISMLIMLKFDSKTIKMPIISKVILETGALINILRANIGTRKGEIIIEVDDEKARAVEEVFKRYGVQVIELVEKIVKDDEKCTHCGLCMSLCPMDVFKFDGEYRIIADVDKCIHCGFCVNACPTKALRISGKG